MRKTILILMAAAAMIACSGKQNETTAAPAPAAKSLPSAVAAAVSTAPVQTPPPVARAAAAPSAITGKVIETMNAAGYTYLQIATANGNAWAAVRETKIKKGATVTIEPQMVAENFESNTLHRKFDRLVMGSLVSSPQPPVAAASVMGTPAQHRSSAMTDAGDTTVQKAEGGITVAEAWSKKAELKDKPVVIRGKVVKFLPDIMGKNWMHVRDGSGKRADGTDDITVTTSDVVKVGDVVTVRGTLRLDKDFGAGYVYPIIVEDAKVEK